MKRLLFYLLIVSGFCTSGNAQQVAPLWQDFVNARQAGTTPILPDYSYAGYHFSEIPIPDVSGRPQFNVTNFGALPNDNNYDDAGIQAAVHAAEANPGGGVVFFPPGKYIISPNTDVTKYIRISKSNIVLKGSGSGVGGTEIFQDSMRIATRQFQFRPVSTSQTKITTITKDAVRESFWIEVASTAALSVGQRVVIKHKSEEFTRAYFAPLQLKPEWTRLFGATGGMQISEMHTIEAIEGNRVKFVDPIHFDLKLVASETFDLTTYQSIKECGVEDILFTSNWKNYGETFSHHKNAIHDSGWCTLAMEYVEDSWIRNCDFRDYNETAFMRAAYKFTMINTKFSGKKGHSAVHSRSGTAVLVKNCQFNGAHHHGPGTGYNHVGYVVTQCTLNQGQSIDSHGGVPYASLFDDITGGVVSGLGGPEEGHPHHGRDFTAWNWVYRSNSSQTVNFWNLERRENNTFAFPTFVGLQPNNSLTFINVGRDEQRGVAVSPKSLFEAQLALRLAPPVCEPAKASADDGNIAANVLDGNLATRWSADGDGQWIQFCLDATKTVSGVKIAFFKGNERSSTFDVLVSTDGTNFTPAASARVSSGTSLNLETFTFTPKTAKHVRIVGHGNSVNTWNSYTEVEIITGVPNNPPSVAITSPANNTSFNAPATVTINASASDDGSITKIEFFQGTTKLGEDASGPYSFVWSNVAAGSYNLTAKATDNLGLSTTSTIITINVNQPPAVSIASPSNGATFNVPDNIAINANASDSDGTVAKVEFFQGATKLGEDLTSPYSFTWSGATPGSYSLTAKATDNLGSSTTSTVITINVNQPPVVSITSPSSGATFIVPDNITINANASDSDGTVTKVEFFQGTTKLGEDLTSPYSFTWSGATQGSYSLTAKATDNDGAVTTSASVAITVNTNQAPAVSIASPANGATFIAPATITIDANASDNDGTVSKVEFFQGASKLGEDLTSPYSFMWSNAAAGSYSLTAHATDNRGSVTVSTPVSVTVNAAPVQSPFGGTVRNIPGKIEAEHYDLGGQGIAYNDLTTGNSGNVFRTDDVDVQSTTDTGAGHNIGFVQAGEWMEYTVNVTTAGIYNLEVRVAATTIGKTFHIELNGLNISGAIAIPNTTSYQLFQTVTVTTPILSAGQKVMRIVMDSPSFNLNHVNFVLVQSPFGGTVRNIPGKVEAEHYDLGGQGIAYNDLTAGNSGNTFRTDDVDVQLTTDTGGGNNIGFVQAGEWLEYIVNVTSSGAYTLEARVSATSVGRTFHVELNGQNISGTITVPNTGNYQAFQTVSVTTPSLTAGLKIMRIVMGTSSFNINYLNFTPAGSLLRVASTAISEESTLFVAGYPNPFTKDATIKFSLNEEGQTSLIVHDITGKNVSTLENSYLPAGIHQRTVRGDVLPAGVYIIKLVHNKKIATALLLKQ